MKEFLKFNTKVFYPLPVTVPNNLATANFFYSSPVINPLLSIAVQTDYYSGGGGL
ncbi:MAG TPA: hypothetical protein VKA92_13850 [Segetibacter sp.]|nr:hypothetical protein [Segetibacter sp.]